MKRKFFCILMILTLVLSLTPTIFASPVQDIKETRIQQLYDQRAAVLNEEIVDMNKVDNIDKQLKSLGVEFITSEQVRKQFHNENMSPNVSLPQQDNVSWSTYRTEIIKDGITYEVQRLIAQPNSKSSNLKAKGNKALSST
ncbi:hypothetical protein D3C87_443100 [compost metagenome]